jgi:hypothetical protein
MTTKPSITINEFLGLPTHQERRENAHLLTEEQKKQITDAMFCPVRCGGCHYDERGRPIYIHGGKPCTPKEHNDIIRAANPTWSEEALKPYLIPNEDD